MGYSGQWAVSFVGTGAPSVGDPNTQTRGQSNDHSSHGYLTVPGGGGRGDGCRHVLCSGQTDQEALVGGPRCPMLILRNAHIP